MRIAILKNDSVIEELRPRFSDYDQMIIDWLVPMQAKKFTVYDLQKRERPSFDYDLYVSSGSRRSVYEEEDWISHYRDIVLALHERKKSHFGICFGHQMIAHVLGAKVAKTDNWGIGVHSWKVLQKKLIDKEDLSLCVSHRDQVQEYLPEMSPFLSSDFCPVAGFSVGRHILTVQGHPEFRPAYVEAIMEIRKPLYSETIYEEGKTSLTQPIEPEFLIPVIKNFFFRN